MTIEGDLADVPQLEGNRDGYSSSAASTAVPVVKSENEAHTASSTIEKAEMIPRPYPSPYAQPQSGVCSRQSWVIIVGVVFTILLVVLITLCIVLTRPPPVPPPPPPSTISFATGVSIITHYAVDTKVRSRLATTNLTMEVQNGMNCSSVHVLTLQLPLNSRVTSLKTMADDGCSTNGQVQEIEEARETFIEQSNKGLASAYVEASDGFTYTVQVSIPPYGATKVELVVEQLLQQRRGEIAFEVPLIPNEEVDSLLFDLSVEDVDGKAVGFNLDLNLPEISSTVNATNGTSHFHLDLPDARQHDIPRVLRGRFAPGEVPENGILHFDGTCFEHYFLPPSLEPMPRNFIFLLDKAQAALIDFIDTLDVQDTFSIQTFAHRGTMDVWGPKSASTEEKADATDYLLGLKPGKEEYWSGWGTDLNAAILEAMIRAKDDIKDNRDDTVSIIVVVSNGWASRGETDRSKILNNIHGYNKDGSVKIFPLGYQHDADMTLLDAIALMNGGISATIQHGEEDFQTQITKFLESELGSILLSDMSIEFSEGVKVVGETNTNFPLLAAGYEVVIRGIVEEYDLDPSTFKTVTKASTLEDVQNWVTIASDTPSSDTSSLCYQSYAHARVGQLVRLRDAASFLDEKILKSLVKLKKPSCSEKEFVKCIENEAIELALSAHIVAKGLTAMVTVDNDECMKVDDSAEVCLDGTTVDERAWAAESDGGYYYDSPSSIPCYSLMICLVALIATWLNV